ncbi:MAG: nucleotidyltransferase domain-containing protein [Oscillospiraceae bacterium]|nr:nucleotidyltransferase domain-containing protein [Oscillospiraceae bacterium]
MYAEAEIRRLTKELVDKFNPEKVILFGSQAKGTATEKSDIDLCVVADVETESKIDLGSDINHYLIWDCDSEKPPDIIVYTPLEWSERQDNRGDFAHIIKRNGVVLHG